MERVFVKVIGARIANATRGQGPCEYFIEFGTKEQPRSCKTSLSKSQLEPSWNQDFMLNLNQEETTSLQFKIFDSQSQLIGESEVALPNVDCSTGITIKDEWTPIITKFNGPSKGELHLSIISGKPQTQSRPISSHTTLVAPKPVRPLAQPQPKYPLHQFTTRFMPDLYGSFDPRRELLVDSPADRYH